MTEDIEIFIRPNQNYVYKTPFQTISIIQMSEDDQDDTDPVTPPPEPEQLTMTFTAITDEPHTIYKTLIFPENQLPQNMLTGTTWNGYADVCYFESSNNIMGLGFNTQNTSIISLNGQYSIRDSSVYSLTMELTFSDFKCNSLVLYNFDRSKFYETLTGGTADLSTITFDKCCYIYGGTQGNMDPYTAEKEDIINNRSSNFYYHVETDEINMTSDNGTKVLRGTSNLCIFDTNTNSCLIMIRDSTDTELTITNASKYIPSLLNN